MDTFEFGSNSINSSGAVRNDAMEDHLYSLFGHEPEAGESLRTVGLQLVWNSSGIRWPPTLGGPTLQRRCAPPRLPGHGRLSSAVPPGSSSAARCWRYVKMQSVGRPWFPSTWPRVHGTPRVCWNCRCKRDREGSGANAGREGTGARAPAQNYRPNCALWPPRRPTSRIG